MDRMVAFYNFGVVWIALSWSISVSRLGPALWVFCQ